VTGIVREFVGLPSPVVGRAGAGGHPCQGIYHRPASGRPRVAFIATHYNVDFSEHYLASFMAERGFGFLGWNTRFRGNEAHFLLDHALAEIGVGVRWLREQAGAEQVVLLGNSGGGSLMAAYQSQATEPSVRPVTGMRPLPAIEDLPPGDLYVALAAHSGRPEVLTACRPIRPSTRSARATARRSARTSSAATGPRSATATSASPAGHWRSWTGWPGRGPGTGCSRSRAAGPTCA
jgi:hypothetical protein